MDKTIQPLTLEIELIILSSRLEPAPFAKIEAIIKKGIDWSRVTVWADRFGVCALLHRQLSQKKFLKLIPIETLKALKGGYTKTAMRNLLIYDQLERLVATFQHQKIHLILLKGAYMAKNVYGDIGLRPMQDLDIMCRREDRMATEKIISELGYRQLAFGFEATLKTPFDDTTFYPPAGKKKDVHIDLHVDPFSRLRLDPVLAESIWESALPLSPENPQLFTLSPEYQLLHLCHHLHKHLVTENIMLYWLSDIHEIIKKYQGRIKWDVFSSMASNKGIGEEVRDILRLVETHWETPLPGELFNGYEKESNIPNLIKMIENQLCEKTRLTVTARAYLTIVKKVKEVDGWKNRLFYLYRQAIPSRECMINRYSPKNKLHLFLLYLLRPFRIGGRIMISLYYNILAYNK